MTTNKQRREDLRHEVEKAAADLGCPEPHLFLTNVMAGADPRYAPSVLYTLVTEGADSENEEGLPPAEVWAQIKALVLENPLFEGEIIPLQESTSAAKELMAYSHPKLKAVQVTGELEHLVRVTPLTDEEIDRFNKRLFDDF
jgi:hypothetical protein